MNGIAEWMTRVLLPGQCVELRGLRPGGGGIARHFLATPEGLASLEQAAADWESQGIACYFIPNPVSDLGEAASKDSDVLIRRWLLVDVEAVRPAGTSTTADEKAAAWATVERIREMLEGNDFPDSVVADSGNGFHLLLPCEMPNSAGANTLCKTFLTGLAHVYNSATVKIDTVNYNASRIVRLYGTMNRKGIHSEERPHRRSWVCTLPEEYDGTRGANAVEVVVNRWKRQEAMAGKAKPPAASISADAVRRAQAYLSRAEPAVEGQGGSQTCFRVACALVHGFSLTDEEAMEAVASWNATCSPPWSDKELRHKLSDARKHTGHPKPRGHLLTEESSPQKPVSLARLMGQPSQPGGEAEPPPKGMRANVLMTQDYPELPCVVSGMIPKGLTLFAGRPKQGKSWAALQMCLNVAMGLPFFGKEVEQGDVLYLALEDHPRRIKERIHQLLGEPPYQEELSRLTFLFSEQVPPGDMRSVEAWLAEEEKPRLVVIDTLGRFTPPSGRSGESFEQIYAVMAAIKALADANNVAIVIIHHTRKMESENPIDAVSGSTAYTAASDAIVVLERNPKENANDATLHVTARDFEQYELNIRWDKAWCVGGSGRQKGSGKSSGESPAKLAQAVAYLTSQLTQPTRVSELIENAGKLPEPISNGTLYRAKDAMGILESKILNKKYWELPEKESN